jgi:hypothetical protein
MQRATFVNDSLYLLVILVWHWFASGHFNHAQPIGTFRAPAR